MHWYILSSLNTKKCILESSLSVCLPVCVCVPLCCWMWPLFNRDWGTNATTALDQWLSGLRLWGFLLWAQVYPRLLLLLIIFHITSEYDLCFYLCEHNKYFSFHPYWHIFNSFICDLIVYTQNYQCRREMHVYTVKLGYSNIGFCDTLSVASNIQWYELIPCKATVFRPCLVRHAQMHRPRM
jgi:hypothetical protein